MKKIDTFYHQCAGIQLLEKVENFHKFNFTTFLIFVIEDII